MTGQYIESARIFREALARKNLRLAALDIPDYAHRLAWLALWLPKFRGCGIVYCLSFRDAQTVADWLGSRGIAAAAHHGKLDPEQRAVQENKLREHRIKVLVTTVTLGVQVDQYDLGFAIHFQDPGSISAYHQQVVVAGRAMDGAYGILLTDSDGEDQHEAHSRGALPTPEVMAQVLAAIGESHGLTQRELSVHVNLPWGILGRAAHVLEAGRLLVREDDVWKRTALPWDEATYRARFEQESESRQRDRELMRAYRTHRGCLMRFLVRALNEPKSEDCGRCINCQGKAFPTQVPEALLAQANTFLNEQVVEIPVRLRWPFKLPGQVNTTIEIEQRHEPGRCLCVEGRGELGAAVRRGKLETGRFDEALVHAAATLVRDRWKPQPAPEWVTCIPSLRHPALVPEVAERIARELGLPFVATLHCRELVPEQKTQKNSAFQVQNAMKALRVVVGIRSGPVLLIDDVVDSGWTLTVAGMLLRQAGASAVLPLALACADGG